MREVMAEITFEQKGNSSEHDAMWNRLFELHYGIVFLSMHKNISQNAQTRINKTVKNISIQNSHSKNK